jgi:type II secretory pathway pseudopilin PulG
MKPSSRAIKQSGFTIMQMVVTIAIIGVVSTFGMLGIRNARAEYRLQNSARQLASYLEKARADAVRRHAAPGSESSVESFGPETNTYAVTMDFGTGALETRTFQLETGVTFDTVAQKTTFDWRGRIVERLVYQVTNGTKSIPVDVSGSGDITIGEQRFPDNLIPAVDIATVTGDVIQDPTPTPDEGTPPSPADNPSPTPYPSPSPSPTGNGNGSGSGGNGNGDVNGNNPHPSPTPTPIPSPSPTATPASNPTPTPLPPCVTTLSPTTLSLSQSDNSRKTGTATFSIANAFQARSIIAALAGSGKSLTISLSLVRIEGSGTSIISVTTKSGAGNRGVFLVNVSTSPNCGTTQHLTVSVSN